MHNNFWYESRESVPPSRYFSILPRLIDRTALPLRRLTESKTLRSHVKVDKLALPGGDNRIIYLVSNDSSKNENEKNNSSALLFCIV